MIWAWYIFLGFTTGITAPGFSPGFHDKIKLEKLPQSSLWRKQCPKWRDNLFARRMVTKEDWIDEALEER